MEWGHLREGFLERELQGHGERSMANGLRVSWVER